MEGDAGVRLDNMRFLNHRKIVSRTAFVVNVENVEDLENLTLSLALSRFGHSPYNAKPANFSGKQVNNETVVAIFHSSEYYATRFFQHNKHKSTKIQPITKVFCKKIWRIDKKGVPLHPQLAKTWIMRC